MTYILFDSVLISSFDAPKPMSESIKHRSIHKLGSFKGSLQRRFVGEIDLPERLLSVFLCHTRKFSPSYQMKNPYSRSPSEGSSCSLYNTQRYPLLLLLQLGVNKLFRSGNYTRKQKHHFGQQKSWIFHTTSWIGTIS